MFDALSDRLRDVLGKLTGHGRITEADVDLAMREVRLALLEADVNFRVVKDFVARVKSRAVGRDVIENVNAGQMVVKIVHEELTAILGAGDRTFRLTGSPAVIALVGLQGSGKTTSSAKLARWIVGLRYEDLPPEVVDRAKGVTLHALASILIGSQTAPGRNAVKLIKDEESGVRNGATIMVDGGRATKGGAAFANSEMAFAGGKWDTFRMLTHPGTSIIPGALAAALLLPPPFGPS